MTKVKFSILFIFSILVINTYSQERKYISRDVKIVAQLEEIDSLQKISANSKLILSKYNSILDQASNNKDSISIVETALLYKVYCKGVLLNDKKTNSLLDELILRGTINKDLPDSLRARAAYSIGSTFMTESKFNESLSYFHKSLDLNKDVGDTTYILRIYANFIRIYYEMDDTTKLAESLLTMEKYIPKGNNLWEGFYYLRFYELPKYVSKEERVKYIQKAKIKLESQERKDYHYVLYAGLAQYYLNRNRLDSSKFYIDKLNELNETQPEYQVKYNRLNAQSIEGLYYFFKRDYNKSMIHFDRAIEMCKEFNIPIQLRTLLEVMVRISADFDDFERAYILQSELIQLNDSLLSNKRIQEYEEFLVQYETENKQQKIDDLEKEQTINDLIIEKQKTFNLSLISITIILTLMGIISIMYFIQKNRNTKKLQELNKLKDQIFSVLSHDLRSPLYSFRSLVQLGRRNYVTPQEFQSFLDTLQEELQSTSMLMESLLRWAESNQKTINVKNEKLDLFSLIEDIIQLYHIDLENKKIQIDLNCPPEVQIESDEELFKFILRNIIHNAIKFSPKGETVNLEVHQSDKVEITITNKGQGFSTEQLNNFLSGDLKAGIDSSGQKSTGLGLTLSKQFADKLHLDISINSVDNHTAVKLTK